jgi:hypothetical protein
MKNCKIILPGFMCSLLLCAFSLRASPPIGAAVQDSHYDAQKGIVTFSILNVSRKDITALSLQVRVIFTDGTLRIFEYGGDFLPFMIYLAEEGHPTAEGVRAPGAVFAMDVPLGQQEVQSASAIVDVVVYADDTADIINEQIFKSIVSQRKGRMLGMQKANELLQKALADPTVTHPSVTVAAQLKALAKEYQTNPPAGGTHESLGLLDAATSISNAPKSPTGRSDKEDTYLRVLIKTHERRISLFLPHTELTKAVQP